jgi:hypothetical protein
MAVSGADTEDGESHTLARCETVTETFDIDIDIDIDMDLTT